LVGGWFGQWGSAGLGAAVKSATQTWTTSAVSGAINAFQLDPSGALTWNAAAAGQGMFGVGTIASMASSFTTSLVGGSFVKDTSQMDEAAKMAYMADRAFYRGGIALATSLSGEAARYATTFGLSAIGRSLSGRSFGSNLFGEAFDAMGGLTLNVANLGALFDFAGVMEAMIGESAQSELGGLAQKLSGSGLLELHLGSKGATMQFGSGGVDLGGSLYALGKGLYDKTVLEDFRKRDAKAGDIAYRAYIAGDWTAGNTARRLALGKDALIFDITQSEAWANASDEERTAMLQTARAVTERDGKGGRSIFMVDAGEGSGAAWNNAIALQHEAYRDGIRGNSKAETKVAVTAHINMARSLLGLGVEGFLDEMLLIDLFARATTDEKGFDEYIDMAYSSEADFWKMLNAGGTRFRYEWDGKHSLDVSEYLEASALTEEETSQLNAQGMSIQNGVVVSNADSLPIRVDTLNATQIGALFSVLGARLDQEQALEQDTLISEFALVTDVTRTRFGVPVETKTAANGVTNFIAMRNGVNAFEEALFDLRDYDSVEGQDILELNEQSIVPENLRFSLANGDILPLARSAPGALLRITTLFGYRLDPSWNGTTTRYKHNQIDGNAGNPIAFSDGTLTFRYNATWGFRLLMLASGSDRYTDTAHCAPETMDTIIGLALAEGTTVSLTYLNNEINTEYWSQGLQISGINQAAVIGIAGTSGYSFGVHQDIQFGTYTGGGSTLGRTPYDPIPYFAQQGFSDYYLKNGTNESSGFGSAWTAVASLTGAAKETTFLKLAGFYDGAFMGVADDVKLSRWRTLMGTFGMNNLTEAAMLHAMFPNSAIITAWYNELLLRERRMNAAGAR
jgi:hypothetical protein